MAVAFEGIRRPLFLIDRLVTASQDALVGESAPFPAELMHTGFGVLVATDTVVDALRAMDRWPRENIRVVIERHEGSKLYYYLYLTDELFARLQKNQTGTGWETVSLRDALQLHEHMSVAKVDARKRLPADLRSSAVVVKGKLVVGYVTEIDIPNFAREDRDKSIIEGIPMSGTLKGDWDADQLYGPTGGSSQEELAPTIRVRPSKTREKGKQTRRAKPPERSNRGAAASMTYVPRPRDGGDDPGAKSALANGGSRETSAPPGSETGLGDRDFKAYPRLDVLEEGQQPKTVKPGAELKITAGFQTEADASISETGAIMARNVKEGETCLLHFFLKGLALTLPTQFSDPAQPHWEILLEPTATVPEFAVTVLNDATEVECKVEYYVRGVLAGIARRKLDLAGAGVKPVKANPCKFNLEDAEPVDLTVSVTHSKADGHLEFVFSGRAVGAEPVRSPAKSDFPDSLQVARDLYDTLKGIDFRDSEARDALDGIGQRIQQLLPDDFFVYVRQAQAFSKNEGRTVPTLLLLTDEAYIPWELTLFEDPAALFDETAPPYLGAQTVMGRWIPSEYIRMPPFAVCNVRKFQVFASPYTKNSTRQRELLAAVQEQKKLVAEYADWNPESYEARRSDLNKVKADKTEGKAVHFAVHGLSDPQANRQQLVLEDARISADTLIGAYSCGQIPRFSFVFMNACQVGIPGEVLGKVAGFPGELVRGGTYGVIAPLWDVHDDVAQECAMAFYQAVFKEGKSVAEALRERRATYTSDSTTPVAYVFYGHPGLKLRKA